MTICDEAIMVELGRMQVVRRRPVVLTCVGLGSSIALCAYDPIPQVAGMAHFVLPGNGNAERFARSAKYVDTGVPLLVQEMIKQGAMRSRLLIKIAGGAQMLSVPGLDGRLNVGQRNIDAIKAALARERLPINAADLGGRYGRTVQLFTSTGTVVVKTVRKQGVELQ